jgi:hypothetical protein
MPSKAYWIEQPYIMSADYEGILTTRDYEQVMNTCLQHLESHRIHFLVDLSKVTAYPLAVAFIPSLLKLINHPNTESFAWVGASRFAKMGIPTVVRKPNRFFNNRDEAFSYLRQHDQVAQAHSL